MQAVGSGGAGVRCEHKGRKEENVWITLAASEDKQLERLSFVTSARQVF